MTHGVGAWARTIPWTVEPAQKPGTPPIRQCDWINPNHPTVSQASPQGPNTLPTGRPVILSVSIEAREVCRAPPVLTNLINIHNNPPFVRHIFIKHRNKPIQCHGSQIYESTPHNEIMQRPCGNHACFGQRAQLAIHRRRQGHEGCGYDHR